MVLLKKIDVMICAIWLAIICLLITPVCAAVYANTNTQYTELKVFNPYSSISIKLLVKCDHDYKTNRYKFYKTVVVRRSSSVIIRAPQNLKKCEIWPMDMKMFGDIK